MARGWQSNEQAAEFVVRAIEAARLRPGQDASLAIDVASTHFFDGTHYRLKASPAMTLLTSGQMIDQLEQLVNRFPMVSIEDGLAEEDWSGWQELSHGDSARSVRLIGDDLIATNASRGCRRRSTWRPPTPC